MARTFYNPYERDPVSLSSNSTDQPKVITSFEIDLSDIKAATTTRPFSVLGQNGAVFSLEVKNEDGHYYNFITKAFQVSVSRLDNKTIENSSYVGAITFPTVADDDHYDIYLWAETNTVHTGYNEVRFGDGSIDINGSTGSNSFLLQKVIYQYTDSTLTLQGFSPNGTVAGTMGTDTVTVARFGSKTKTAFSLTATAGATAAYRVLKQPVANDILSFVEPVIGSAPIDLPGENIYPAVSNTDTVDGTGFAAGTAVKVVMDTNVVDKMAVGDKITIATTALTDTVDGAVSSGVKVVMDNNVATKMAVGDRITATLAGVPHALLTETHPTIVTVAALDPDGDNAKEFSMSQNIGLLEDATLSFSNRKNKRWPLDDISKLSLGNFILPGTNVTSDSFITNYENTITINEGYDTEETLVLDTVPGLDAQGQTPTLTDGIVTTQPGSVIFNKQQALALGGDTISVAGYGQEKVLSNYGYEILFTDLAVSLSAITTTTTSAVSSSTTVPVASVNGVLPGTTTISGIGVDPSSC